VNKTIESSIVHVPVYVIINLYYKETNRQRLAVILQKMISALVSECDGNDIKKATGRLLEAEYSLEIEELNPASA